MENGERCMSSAMVGRAVFRMVESSICMKRADAVIIGSPVRSSRLVSAMGAVLSYAPGRMLSPSAAGARRPLPRAVASSSAMMVRA